MPGSSGAIGIDHEHHGEPRRLSINEMEMARQYSETSTRISQAIERKVKKKGEETDDLKKELEMWEHKVPAQELAERLGTHLTDGLTSDDAAKRLERDGPNTLSPPKVTPWWIKLLKQFTNFFAILLQIASVLCFIGYGLDQDDEANLYLGIVLYAVVIITAIFSFFQEHKSEKTMEKFKNFLPPQAAVYRDGRLVEVPAQDLVVGDVVDVKLGDKLPADVRVTANQKLKVDNSPLTGESEPVGRSVEMTDENPLETKNLAFFGTLAVDGTAQGIVVNTGDRTVFGRIAGLAAGSVSEQTTLQRDIHHFVMIISGVAIFLGVLFFIIGLIKGTDTIRNIVFCIGIIVANVPEGLLATVTVALTLSAKRMAKKNVLVKKLEAVETLGSTTCICSDKTGTLTQNRMTIVHVAYNKQLHTTTTAGHEGTFDQDEKCFQDLFFIAACCGKAVFDVTDMEQFPEKSLEERKVNGDASEAGILKFCEKIHSVLPYRKENPQISGIPFNSTNKFMVTINQDSTRTGDYPLRLCMKGAPERVIDRCSYILTNDGREELTAENRAIINEQLAFMMERGERVLGFAQKFLDDKVFTRDYVFDPEEPNFPMEGLTFVGSMALLDPPREAVPHSVETCQNAGIKVIMVTGDHPATAKSIAKQVNIIRDPTVQDLAKERGVPVDQIDISEVKSIVVPGSQIKDLEEEDWNRVLAHDQIVFARTSPQQKLIIVENNQRLHHIVAVTGDGVNDSPALKKANIGIAMGISGSDVSKEAADMILLDDNFASIVNGIEEGRLIFDNLKKSIAYTLTSNIPEITPFLTFIVISIPQPLTTILILCIDLGTDLLPAISLAYEEAESDIMRRPPRNSRVDRLVNARLISFSYFQIGVIQALAGFFSYLVVFNDFGIPPSELPFLDKDAFFEEESAEAKRWLYVEQERARGEPFEAEWYSEKSLDGTFKEAIGSEDPIYNELLPTEGESTSNTRFNEMLQAIGRETNRPPCLAFECSTGNNDFTCLRDASDVNDFQLTGIFENADATNSEVVEGRGDGEGCFQLWSEQQQDEVLKRAQTAFFVSIVIVQIGGLLVCKTRVLSWFQQGMRNLVLNVGILEELALCAALCYIPFIQTAFGTRPLRAVHWLPAIPFMIFIFVYDETRKWWLRKGDRTGNKFGKWIRNNTYW